jgi:hypothetical protein
VQFLPNRTTLLEITGSSQSIELIIQCLFVMKMAVAMHSKMLTMVFGTALAVSTAPGFLSGVPIYSDISSS